ncbi:response regulator [Pseudoduganella rhizocola]|uniref:response regulator n=1 Tax=Pseudoduganella rhizocola TaxID=3382643 RepID=UPI0038B6549C
MNNKPTPKAPPIPPRPMLLMEPEDMLRRTVSLTARSLGMAEIHEAASPALARQMLKEQRFQGLVLAIDCGGIHDFSLLDQVRQGKTASAPAIPIAVLAERCDVALIAALRERDVSRIILKPFRARVVLDTFAALRAAVA